MSKAKLFNKGDVFLTNPEEGFWGIAVVLSERERTPDFYAMCHIAITPLIFQREVEMSELNLDDLVPLEFERRYTFEKQKIKPEPFTRTETCIGVYTRSYKDDFKIIGKINPELVYSGPLPFEPLYNLEITFPLCGTAKKDSLGREALIMKNEKPAIQLGDVFVTTLTDGRFGAIKVLDVIEKSYLIATTAYIGENIPSIKDPDVDSILRQNRFRLKNEPAITWYDGKAPQAARLIGNLPTTEEEQSLHRNSYGGKWNTNTGSEVLMEWRWAHDRENYEKEVQLNSELIEKRQRELRMQQGPKDMMEDQKFWDLISKLDWSKEGDDDEVVAPLVRALKKMKVKEIYQFQETLAFKLYQMDTREHAEAYEPNGEISSDGFLYARCVVVANGEKYYNRVLREAWRMPRDLEFEALLYVAQDAYELRTGNDFDYETGCDFESFSNENGWKAKEIIETKGESQLKSLFRKLLK